MISFLEALRIVGDKCPEGRRAAEIEIAGACGFVLAEDVVSDIDMPRFDRAMMDGYAFRRADVPGRGPLRIADTIAAGDARLVRLAAGECARTMTGAPVPEPADTVVPREEAEEVGDRLRIERPPARGAHVSPSGEDLRAGDVALRMGTRLDAAAVGVLAAVGRRTARVFPPPAVACAATGDELVEPGEELGPGKIRNGNASMLCAQIAGSRGVPRYLGIIRDREDDLRAKIADGLGADMLVLSGGISMGSRDLVPSILEECGVRLYFRRVRMKPGSPTLFGARDGTLVFGLAGNPVASLFGFELFVRPAIRAFLHHARPETVFLRGELDGSIANKEGRTGLVPCIARWEGGGFRLAPLAMHGSADLFAVAGANAIAVLPEESRGERRGAAVDFCLMGER